MTDDAAALRAAIDLVHRPFQARKARAAPLPRNVLVLLRLVAGDETAKAHAARLTGRSGGALKEAAAFFIQQILLSTGADSYRVLGLTPDASSAEIRRNMILLLKWLHPDVRNHDAHAVFAGRVLQAWSDLKTPARRAAYDQAIRSGIQTESPAGTGVPRSHGRGVPPNAQMAHRRPKAGWMRAHSSKAISIDRRLRRRLLSLFTGART